MSDTDETTDVVVVGAGFAGLYAIHRLRADGWQVRCFEAGSDVGGTWYWNRYPGARCDVESLDYSYSFSPELEQEWDWTERYATQPEILRYLKHVADRFDLRRSISFDTSVTSATFDAGSATWTVSTNEGEQVSARYLIFATGPLSVANTPAVEGMESFTGRTFHTGAWPHEGVDFTGRDVAVIGTGSSGIQLIPMLAAQARSLKVLQRTPNFSIPAQNAPLSPQVLAESKAAYADRRARSRASAAGTPHPAADSKTFDVDALERTRRFEARWQFGGATFAKTFADQMLERRANDEAVSFVHDKIRNIVRDPQTAKRLLPTDHPLGAKRICVDTAYYDTFNRDNVELIDVRDNPIRAVESTGLRLSDRRLVVDDIVFATGFDAMTGALARIDIVGREGQTLLASWAEGPKSYLGLSVAGFPNMFIINGPGSPSVLANMVLTAEQQVDWVADALEHLKRQGVVTMEAQLTAQERWIDHCNALAADSLAIQANSWYLGANIPGKPRVFMPYIGGFARYGQQCTEVADDGYPGFDLVASSAG